jgi:hypothetical protein
VHPATILTALADLAPAGRERVFDATGGRALVWLADPDRAPRTRTAERLAATDALHHDERVLRRGWVFVVGSTEIDGAARRVCVPLLSEPVRMRRSLRGYTLEPAGDLEITPLIEDHDLAAELERDGGNTGDWLNANPSLNDWIRAATRAAGLPVGRILRRRPVRPRRPAGERAGVRAGEQAEDGGLVAVRRAGVYVVRDVFSGSVRETLRGWAARPGLEQTALAAVYGVGDDRSGADGEGGTGDGGTDHGGDVLSPLPLDAAQTEVVRRARTERVTVVSGPPGSGKSHAVAAAALEVVDRGGSVLLATQSSHAADVLGQLLDRYPGPTPVLFGDAEHRGAVAADLAQGTGAGVGADTLRRDQRAVAAAAARVRELSAAIGTALEVESRAAELPRWQPLLPALASDAPGAFAGDADLDPAGRLAGQLTADQPPGLVARLRRWWVRRRLYALLQASPAVALDRLRAAITAGRAAQAAGTLAASGGTDLGAAWQALHQAEADLAAAVGVAMRHRAGSAARWDRAARRSAAALAGALRAGRNRRRQLLAGMDGGALVRGLPLWVGTAADSDDLLPPVPGLFDLVILDEASHLDQLRAAPVLARARRTLVVGDPRQLRFVSFVADVDVMATLHRYSLDDRADVRRVSAFDLATGAAPVTWLDQHYRCAPHLIGFSARRFYAGRLTVATRHPANDSRDVIEVVRVEGGEPGGAGGTGVNRVELAAAVRVVRDLAAAGTVGIGVITPFRSQADALESALVEAFSVAELERLALRVGTVHAFQGSEAGTVVVSLAINDDDPPSRTRFVADPQLFNVMVTRARHRMVVVTSLRDPGGVVGDYLSYADDGPEGVAGDPPGGPAGDWTAALATELRRAGLTVRHQYPVGRWTVDLVAGDGPDAFGLCCRVHPDGPAAHLLRQQALARAGWRLVDAFASRWSDDATRAALALSGGAGHPEPLPFSSTTTVHR